MRFTGSKLLFCFHVGMGKIPLWALIKEDMWLSASPAAPTASVAFSISFPHAVAPDWPRAQDVEIFAPTLDHLVKSVWQRSQTIFQICFVLAASVYPEGGPLGLCIFWAAYFDANDGKWMYKMHRFEVGLQRLLFLFEAKGPPRPCFCKPFKSPDEWVRTWKHVLCQRVTNHVLISVSGGRAQCVCLTASLFPLCVHSLGREGGCASTDSRMYR